MSHARIVIDPTVAEGSPILQESQIPVHEILAAMATGMGPKGVLDQFPNLDLDDVKSALEYASLIIGQQTKLPAQAQALVDDSGPEQEAFKLDPNKILVVDDTEDNRVLMEFMFRKTKYKLIMAANGQEALALARQELPILIVSDIQMPVMSGFDLLKSLKADERTKNIAVILVTAHHRSSNQVSQGLIMGADDYIQRPFMPDEFLSRIEAVVRVKWAEAEAQRQAWVVARRNKELELVNEIALAVNSSLDLQEIFGSAMQKLSDLLNAEAVSVLILNEDMREMMVNVASQAGERLSVRFNIRKDGSISQENLQEHVPAILARILARHYGDFGIDYHPDSNKIHCVSMLSREQVIGAIAIVGKGGASFENADWVLLHSAAGIIAVAVENARLLESAQKQVDDLIALNEIGRALTSNLDLEQTLKQTTLFVQRALQSEAVSLWLLDKTGQELVLTTASGVGSETVTGFRLPIDRGIAGYVAQTGESYISADLSKDDHHFDKVPMSDYKPGSILSIPVQVKGKIIGVMQALHRNVNWFDQDHLRLSYPVANFVGIAVENAQLFSEIQGFSRHLEQMVAERTRALADEQEKTQAILASMADGLLVFDADNCVLTANIAAEAMLDFRLSEMAGQLIGPERLKNPLWQAIDDITNDSAPVVTALVDVVQPQTGALLSIQARSAKVRNETGQVIGTVIVLRDITALKEVERIKARFMAGVTHELKTPLSVIRLHSKNLLAYHDRLPAGKRIDLLNAIQNQAALLGQLIEDVLELSRLDAGVIDLDRKAFDLAEQIERIVSDLRPLAEAKGIKLSWYKPLDSITLMGDQNQVKRVIRNLIDNAIKYTPDFGQISVGAVTLTRHQHSVAQITVGDTGTGIPVQHQARVFDRFHRVDPSHTIPGTGLGLSIVKEIVNAHGGEVHLESEEGVGSTFTVELPIA